MKKATLAVAIVLLVAVLGLTFYWMVFSEKKTGGGVMTIESVFKDGEEIPRKYTCDGQNVSPKLVIKSIPKEAVSLAIIVDDPDAPIGTFTHWVAWNIPVKSTEVVIPEAVPRNAANMIQGMNDFRRNGYDGPCPPPGHGKHHYHFKIYALDTTLNLPRTARRKDLLRAMEGHIIAQTEIVGLYGR